MIKINNIKYEHSRLPLAITIQNPRFSWELEADKNNVYQAAYRIIVYQEDQAAAWDSGWVEGDQTIGIEYVGEALRSGSVYSYQISVRDGDGEDWKSEVNHFETAFTIPDGGVEYRWNPGDT